MYNASLPFHWDCPTSTAAALDQAPLDLTAGLNTSAAGVDYTLAVLDEGMWAMANMVQHGEYKLPPWDAFYRSQCLINFHRGHLPAYEGT